MATSVENVLSAYRLLNPPVTGKYASIRCPFHDDRTPSCNVNIFTGYFRCFGCSVKGFIIDLIAKVENIPFLKAAIKWESGFNAGDIVPLEHQEASFKRVQEDKEALQKAFNFYRHCSKPTEDGPVQFLLDRGFELEFLKQQGLRIHLPTDPAMSTEHPLIFPLRGQNYEFLGLVRRRADGEKEGKYRNSKGFHRNQHLVGPLIPGPVLVTEGLLDAWKAKQFGFSNAVSLMGCEISPVQLEKLFDYSTGVIDGLDNDAAGMEASRFLKSACKNSGISYKKFPFPDGIKDIGEMDKEMFTFGKAQIGA